MKDLKLIAATLALAFTASVGVAQTTEPEPLPKGDGIRVTPIAPAAESVPVTTPAAATTPAPAPATDSQSAAKSPPAAPAAASAAPAATPKTVAPAKEDPNEVVRRAIREKMQGRGDLIIRAGDAIVITESQNAPAAPAKPAAPPTPPATAKPAAAAAPAEAPTPAVPVARPALPAWSYEGERGPAAWGKLGPAYSLCERGRFQSPIDIRDGVGVDLPSMTFAFKPSLFRITDTGKTLEVQNLGGGGFSILGNAHRLTHIAFRHPAEEKINGKSFDMSMQLHHRDGAGRTAVVTVLLSATGAENPVIQTLWNHIPLLRNEPVAPPDTMIDLNLALPKDRGYFNYMGSLTTPPCTEGVTWFVLKTPVEISTAQLAIFARLYPNNARPVQPVNDRLIKESRSKSGS